MNTPEKPIIATRSAFTNPLPWRCAMELLRRGHYRIQDRVRHLTWEWIAIEVIGLMFFLDKPKNENSQTDESSPSAQNSIEVNNRPEDWPGTPADAKL